MSASDEIASGSRRDPLWALTGYVMCCLVTFISLFIVVVADVVSPGHGDPYGCLIEQAAIQMDQVVKP